MEHGPSMMQIELRFNPFSGIWHVFTGVSTIIAENKEKEIQSGGKGFVGYPWKTVDLPFSLLYA